MRLVTILFLLLMGCTEARDPTGTTTAGTDASTPPDPSTSSDDAPDTDPNDVEETEPQWGDITTDPPMTFFASDLSEAVRNGVNNGLAAATSAWGNYGPLEYWVLGTDEAAGLELIDTFCEQRESLGQWTKAQCLSHHTEEGQDHNFLSYLRIGQEVIANNTPMGSMGRNGRREWGLHLFTSSYPFGFDEIFDGIIAEEETKTLFHEYFHAVQHAHIFSLDYDERDRLLGPTWFVEGGAEYMAQYTTSKMWASGELATTDGASYPSFRERMEWKLVDGKRNLEENCPDHSLGDITYADPCSYAAYELGAWGHAYLQHYAGEDALLEVFYPKLEEMGWELAFEEAYGMSPDTFYYVFNDFLTYSIAEQLAILADI